MGAWSPLIFCGAICGLVLLVFAQIHQMPTEYNVVILGIEGPYRFTFQHLDSHDRPVGHSFTEDICQDYAAPGDDFQIGLILDQLTHDEERTKTGVCWSLNPDKHCGWFKRRDVRGNPVYIAEAKL